MYSFDILPTSQVPNSYSLITTATPKYTLMSRMPYCCIYYKIMLKSSLTALSMINVPELDCPIVTCTKYFSLVNMIPFATENFTSVLLKYANRLIVK